MGMPAFCVELLTSQDADHCKALAHEAELANTRRKALQQDVYHQVMAQVSQVDLATTQCLVLASEQWPAGILGLVAGQVSQQLGRPTVLLRTDPPPADGERWLARGSARSVQGLDLYELFKAQADLLSGFGGHPLAAGLTLPVDNIPMLRSALNRAVREALGDRGGLQPTLAIDLTATVTDLGQDLFRELRVLEPYGMGNPVPRLLIRNAWFERGFHRNLRDRTGRTVKFIKTAFQLWDDTTQTGFPGEWWGHYKDELPAGRCDVVVELDHNAYQGYHVKLVDVRPTAAAKAPTPQPADSILDWRLAARGTAAKVLPVEQIPPELGCLATLAKTGNPGRSHFSGGLPAGCRANPAPGAVATVGRRGQILSPYPNSRDPGPADGAIALDPDLSTGRARSFAGGRVGV